MANVVVHFEIYVDDMDRAERFYRAVFAWAFQRMEAMNYTLVYPGGVVTEGPAQLGINGGMLLRPSAAPADNKAAPNAFVCTISVDDVDATLSAVVSNGGRVDMPVTVIPGVGRLAYVRDTEFNLLGILQPEPRA